MLEGVDIRHMSKGRIVKKLRDACCPVLEKLSEENTPA